MRQLALLMYLILFSGILLAQERGVHRVFLQAETQNGEQLQLYMESHALLIGVSEYTQWPRLDSIPEELDQVEQALKAQDFNVVRLANPTSDELADGIKEFIGEYGYERENRLLIYFSGHGYSIDNKGFLIPADTPSPGDKGFRRKTFPMSRVLSWARDMEAKHVLFLFDSCFSGSVFKSRNLPDRSKRYIRQATAEPVRQFITAGGADQEVPAKSTFTPALVRAINGEGDLNNDGYVTGSELGVHLSQLVPRYVNQTPQYGKIKDYDLAQGDFVFFNQNNRQAPQLASVSDQSLEALLWKSAENGNTVKEYQAYINRYPRGTFTEIAQTRIDRLERNQAITVAPIDEEPELPIVSKTGTLTIRVVPSDARVRIMNIVPRYRDGIELGRGKSYDILVTREGYRKERRMIRLIQKNQTEEFSLERQNNMSDSSEEVLSAQSNASTDDGDSKDERAAAFTQQEEILAARQAKLAPDISGIKFGEYHALIIGNSQFENLQNLKTPENDAVAVEALLREKYGFKTNLLLNATRYDILSAFKNMRENLTYEDNLLIYYAGHGELAEETGYWLPVDAEPDNSFNWIPNSTITKYVETIDAKHIMIVADSSYSKIGRAPLAKLIPGLTPQQKLKWYETNANSRVRTVFESGSMRPVLDSVGGASRISIFSAAFLDELNSSDEPVVPTSQLFLRVQEKVKAEAARIGLEQNPQYSLMEFAGHESGEFLFVAR